MGKWLRRIRGAIGMGLTWGAAWGVVGMLPQQPDGGELDRLRHKIGVQIDRAQRLVELAQLGRPAETAE